MEELPLQPLRRIIRKQGLRASPTAAEELGNYLEDIATTIAVEAKTLALHAGRKTVTRSDILLALDRLE